jgi:DNA-binding beta-propeller fold protein YncE
LCLLACAPGAAAAADKTLPTGWRIRPAGRQIALDSFPFRAAALSGGRMLVLHSGYKPPSLAIVKLATGAVEKSLRLPDAGQGMAVDARTGEIFVAGGHASAVFAVDAELQAARTFALAWPGGEYPRSYAADVALSADGKLLYVAEQHQDSIAVLDRSTGRQLRRFSTCARPARVLPSRDGRRLFAACAGEARVVAHDAASGARLAEAAVSPQPADLLEAGERLLVASAGSSSVDVLDASGARLAPIERLNLSLFPGATFQMTPSHLALDAAGRRLYVTCSDANAVAAIDLKERRVAGYLPTGWYPTATLPLADGALLVLNGKGGGSRPNPGGPNPTRHRSMTPQPPTDIEYIPLTQMGSASLLAPLDGEALRRNTAEVYRLTPKPAARAASVGKDHPVSLALGAASPIRHAILIMKENRTYDQVLGDLPQGNGDESLCLFPERITPNHHKLARAFTLFDNFYVNADVSAEGWLWTSAAIVPHFTMRSWPAAYAARTRPQGAKGRDQTATPTAGYLWSRALAAGLSYRNYGFFVSNRKGAAPGEEVFASVSDPALEPHTNRYYAGYDPGFPDVARARVFLDDLKRFEAAGEMPRLITLVLPNDHTFGTAPGKLSPYSSVADNDLALGRIVEAVTRSRFWASTAIFVLEDDAQNGPDHVDSHRSPAFVISPYTRRGFVDSTMYTTTSFLRTIGLILGLEPLTQYDARAVPVLAAFQPKPDLTPYRALPANVSLTELNPPTAPQAARSQALDWSAPDRIDDRELNQILWLAVKGTAPPAPTRSVFVREAEEEVEGGR